MLFLLKEASLAAQLVLIGSVGVTCRLGAQNAFWSVGPSGVENKPYLKMLFCGVTLVYACTVTYSLCTIWHISLVPGTLSWRGPMPIHGRQQHPFPRRGGQALHGRYPSAQSCRSNHKHTTAISPSPSEGSAAHGSLHTGN